MRRLTVLVAVVSVAAGMMGCEGGGFIVLSGREKVLKTRRLTFTNCHFTPEEAVAGDDRGGIGISKDNVFLNGDSQAGRFHLDGPTLDPNFFPIRDGIVSNLATGVVYTLAESGGTLLTRSNYPSFAWDRLAVLDTNLAPTGETVQLDSPIVFAPFGTHGVFSGANKLIFYGAPGFFETIDLPSGTVSYAGGPVITPNGCENWASWGWVEAFQGDTYVTYVNNGNEVLRQNIFTGDQEVLLTWTASDMCSIVPSLTRSRWYWHYEFGLIDALPPAANGGNVELLGYCDATFSLGETSF